MVGRQTRVGAQYETGKPQAATAGAAPGKRTQVEQLYGAATAASAPPTAGPSPEAVASADPAAADNKQLEQALAQVPPAQAAQIATAGQSSPLPFQAELESQFGTSLSDVKAHLGTSEAKLGLAMMSAEAATVGRQVAFASPSPSRELVAHELTHVIQQRAGAETPAGAAGSTLSEPGQTAEREASRVGAAAATGAAVGVQEPAPAGTIHRSWLGALVGGVVGALGGAVIGGLLGGPVGAIIGGVIGAVGGGVVGGLVSRSSNNTPTPVGRAVTGDFGTYWVVPDGTAPQVGVVGEQISETDFAALQAVWTKINDGSGQIKIRETGDDGTAYPGFKAKMITQFGKLLSKPAGRGVVTRLIGAGHTVTIIPSGARSIGGARRGAGSVERLDGSANTGGDSIILIEAGLTDTDIVCYDPAGNEISAPIFLILGHELIHATHNDAGRNHRERAAVDGTAYPNLEEEETIATGSGTTENTLRAEHGLGVRKGHRLRDTR